MTGAVTTGVSVAVLAALASTAGAALALALFGAGYSLAFAAAVPWLDEAFGELQRGLAYGVLNVVYAAGYAIGPLVAGVLLEVGSADLAYWLTAAACGLQALVLASASRTLAPSS